MQGKYVCAVEVPVISSDATILIKQKGIFIKHNSHTYFIDYLQIKEFKHINCHILLIHANYEIKIDMPFSHIEGFLNEFWTAYNKQVEKSLLIKEANVMTVDGEYFYMEGPCINSGKAIIKMFNASLCIFPQNNGVKRIPFCFVKKVDIDDWNIINVQLNSGDSCRLAKLGENLAVFVDKLTSLIDQNRIE